MSTASPRTLMTREPSYCCSVRYFSFCCANCSVCHATALIDIPTCYAFEYYTRPAPFLSYRVLPAFPIFVSCSSTSSHRHFALHFDFCAWLARRDVTCQIASRCQTATLPFASLPLSVRSLPMTACGVSICRVTITCLGFWRTQSHHLAD